jgi:hypothetical protein
MFDRTQALTLPHARHHRMAGMAVRVRSWPDFDPILGPHVVIDWFDRLFDESVLLSPRDCAFGYRVRHAYAGKLADHNAVVISNLHRLTVVHNTDLILEPTVHLSMSVIPTPMASRPHVNTRIHSP